MSQDLLGPNLFSGHPFIWGVTFLVSLLFFLTGYTQDGASRNGRTRGRWLLSLSLGGFFLTITPFIGIPPIHPILAVLLSVVFTILASLFLRVDERDYRQ